MEVRISFLWRGTMYFESFNIVSLYLLFFIKILERQHEQRGGKKEKERDREK